MNKNDPATSTRSTVTGSPPASGPAPNNALRALMRPYRTVRRKLIGMGLITTAIALLVAGSAMLAYDLGVYRQTWAADLATEGDIVALLATPALAFDDRESAARSLSALEIRSSILVAALYDANNNLYSSFVRAGQTQPPPRVPSLGGSTRTSPERLELTRPVIRDGEFLGTVFLRAHYDVTGRITTYLGIFSLVTLLSMIVALLLSTLLQKVITAPLTEISGIAHKVVAERDYSLRARKTSEDEIGVVVDAFNSMLDEVRSRTLALEQSNRALTSEIQERKDVERALRRSEKLYRAIGESLNYGVWVCDAAGSNTYASDSFLRLTGMTQEQCSNLGWGNVLHPDDAEATIAAWQECAASGRFWYREHRILGTDGEFHWVLAQGVPVRDEHDRITAWAGINLDISRLKLSEGALREADRRKDEFLATLAHELRNPLAPIRHAAKVLEDGVATGPEQRHAREVISRQVQRMALLLDDLLDVSRITRGQLRIRKAHTGLASIVGAAIETARPLIDAKGHRLTVELPTAQVVLDVDALRLSQALSNLLTNAAKYTDAGGKIDLVAVLAADGLNIGIRDNGVGIDARSMPGLFEMFSQVESVIDRAEGGLGIGLALVKGLVSLHGGSVEVMSRGLGLGSEFTIRLPKAAVVAEAVESGQRDDSCLATSLPPARVLVADDNRDAAEMLGMLLRLAGFQILVTHDAQDALEIASRERPHAAILDIGMPGMNGYELARRIRAEPWGKDMMLVAVTGWGQENDRQRAESAGFDRHFTKPVDPDLIEQALRQHLAAATSPGAVVHG